MLSTQAESNGSGSVDGNNWNELVVEVFGLAAETVVGIAGSVGGIGVQVGSGISVAGMGVKVGRGVFVGGTGVHVGTGV